MINRTRNPEKQKLSDQIQKHTEAFLNSNGKIDKIPLMSCRADVPMDQWTEMRRKSETCQSRKKPKV